MGRIVNAGILPGNPGMGKIVRSKYQKVIKEFLSSNLPYAEVIIKFSNGKEKPGTRRYSNRVCAGIVKTLTLKDIHNVKCRVKHDRVWLVRADRLDKFLKDSRKSYSIENSRM